MKADRKHLYQQETGTPEELLELAQAGELESGDDSDREETVATIEGDGATGPSGSAVLAMTALAAIAVDLLFNGGSVLNGLGSLFRGNRIRAAEPEEEKKAELLNGLAQSWIDPETFDALLTNEMNRRLKKQFGYLFLGLTVLFTTASYVIVVLNGVLGWNISEVAVTALIIETPIQFCGLLYVIARNLFPRYKESALADCGGTLHRT